MPPHFDHTIHHADPDIKLICGLRSAGNSSGGSALLLLFLRGPRLASGDTRRRERERFTDPVAPSLVELGTYR